MAEKILQDCAVLLTRPIHQIKNLANLIAAEGGDTILFPTIAIQPLRILNPTQSFDFAIFTSFNAVVHGQEVLKKLLKDNLKIVAIGEGTKQALISHGIKVDLISAPPFNSENLLYLREFNNVTDNNIIIFTGKNSRQILFDTLQQRGAKVLLLEVYERVVPDYASEKIKEISQQKFNIIVTTSNEGLKNLIALLPSIRHTIENTIHVVVSERGYQLAKSLQIKTIFKTDNVSDDAIIKTIETICKKKLIQTI